MRLTTTVLALVGALAVAGAAHARPGTATLVFASNRADGVRELYVVRRDGSGERRLTFNDVFERQPVWSPDGGRIAFAGLEEGNWDIYTVDAAGKDLRRLTDDPERDDYPKWTSDGRLVFQRGPFECPCEAWIMAADGTQERRLETGPGNTLTPEPSPHGRLLAFASDRDGPWSLYTMPLDGGAARRLTDAGSGFGDFNPRWSPQGNQIAFLRDHDGSDNDLFVVRANEANLRRLTTTPERVEFWPSWTPDGSEIVFTAGFGPQRLRAISLDDGHEEAVSTWPTAPLVESFEDGIRDGSLWHQIVDPGATLAETNGRLELAIAADAVPGGPFNQVDTHYGSQCALAGDFDVQVDYQLLQWPSPGVFAGLHAFFASAGVSRISSIGGDDYTAWSGSAAFVSRPTADRAGSMRLVRTDGVLSAFYRSGGGLWQPLLAAPADPSASLYGAGLTAEGDWFSHLPAAVAYDNLRLNSGPLSCPDWWSDFAADATGSGADAG